MEDLTVIPVINEMDNRNESAQSIRLSEITRTGLFERYICTALGSTDTRVSVLNLLHGV